MIKPKISTKLTIDDIFLSRISELSLIIYDIIMYENYFYFANMHFFMPLLLVKTR